MWCVSPHQAHGWAAARPAQGTRGHPTQIPGPQTRHHRRRIRRTEIEPKIPPSGWLTRSRVPPYWWPTAGAPPPPRTRRRSTMTTGFEFFEGAATVSTTAPRITVRRTGQLVLTQAAVAMLGEGATHVQIGYNEKTKAVGIRSVPEDAKGRYRLRSQTNGVSFLVDGKRFFAHHGLSVEQGPGVRGRGLRRRGRGVPVRGRRGEGRRARRRPRRPSGTRRPRGARRLPQLTAASCPSRWAVLRGRPSLVGARSPYSASKTCQPSSKSERSFGWMPGNVGCWKSLPKRSCSLASISPGTTKYRTASPGALRSTKT